MGLLLLLLIVIGFLAFVKLGTMTYTMTPENLKQTLELVDEIELKKYYEFRPGTIPALIAGKQFHNGIKAIECQDRKDERYSMEVNNWTQVRITRKGGARQIVYFDTTFIKDNLFYGSKTHFTKSPVKPFPVEEISKVEFQFRGSKKKARGKGQ